MTDLESKIVEAAVPEPMLDQRAKDAVHAARDAAYAIEIARQAQIEAAAAEAAQRFATRIEEKTVDEHRLSTIIREQIENVLARGTEQEKSVILARVPFICQDIKKFGGDIEKIKTDAVTKEDFDTLKLSFLLSDQRNALTNKIVMAAAAFILVAFLGGLTFMVFKS